MVRFVPKNHNNIPLLSRSDSYMNATVCNIQNIEPGHNTAYQQQAYNFFNPL